LLSDAQVSTPAEQVSASRSGLILRLAAEVIGTCLLAAVVIGSGIAAQTLSPNDVGMQLLENAAATAAGLFAIILIIGRSAAHTSTRWSPWSRSASAA
jgi:arsenate reductase